MTLKKIEDTKPEDKKKEVWIVVDKLPVQEVRSIEKDGVINNFITIEEALASLINGRE